MVEPLSKTATYEAKRCSHENLADILILEIDVLGY